MSPHQDKTEPQEELKEISYNKEDRSKKGEPGERRTLANSKKLEIHLFFVILYL